MHVSVIIPAYNAAETIADTLESLRTQTSPDWEAIVVNDGSSDATDEIAGTFVERDARIRLIGQLNGGEGAARNTGIVHARYDWLLFLDADDWIAPVYLERMTNELIAHPEFDAVHCGSARVALDSTLIVEQYWPPTGDMFSTWARRSAFPVHACVVRRSLVEGVGNFDPSFCKCADWDLWQRIARTGACFGAVREVLAYYRMRPNSASLDACSMLHYGLRVLKQGHAPDPRVPHPHPDHAHGLPPELIQTQEYYLLCWCAGLILGCGKDARPLLEMVKEDHYSELYPDAVAQCIFAAAPLPTCQPPSALEQLWPHIQQPVDEFLIALEQQSRAPDVARRTRTTLTKMILQHAPTWRPIVEEHEQTLHQQRMTLEELQQAYAVVEQQCGQWRQRVQEHEQTLHQQRMALEELRQAYAVVEQQCGQWQQRVQEHAARIATLEDTRWVRLGSRFGLLKQRRHVPTMRARHLMLPHWAEECGSILLHQFQLIRLRTERWHGKMLDRGARRHVLATACWHFPIYSQTFVYQEITQLLQHGFDVRFLYSELNPRAYLPSQFSRLWHRRRKLLLHPDICQRDYAYFVQRMPEKIDRLVDMVCKASGMSPQELRSHHHFLQAFAFTRMVAAYQPEYLHSYFFYEGTLFTLFASYLLDIPRGVSCYADHMLKDYILKMVPLHLATCNIVIATSQRIKQELIDIAPEVDPERIIVKPNAVNSAQFPAVRLKNPEKAQPDRLICVSRIEPKKGHAYLVEAVRYLRERNVQVELHVIGGVDDNETSKEYARVLRAQIEADNLGSIIHLEGHKSASDIKQFFQLSPIFVAPFIETESGDKDGIPTALLEAMASGLPIVATDAGSIREVIDDGHDGILVPQRDAHALAMAVAGLMNDFERRVVLGTNAVRKIQEKFDVTVCEPIFYDRLSKLLATQRTEYTGVRG